MTSINSANIKDLIDKIDQETNHFEKNKAIRGVKYVMTNEHNAKVEFQKNRNKNSELDNKE